MKNQPLVKIGIPTYNRPRGLYNILTWLRIQPYKNIEVYISDNCSDNPQVFFLIHTICNADKRFKYQVLPSNIGAHANFGSVYNFAGPSQYFMYMADDDRYEDNFIEACVDYLEQNSSYSLCTGTVFSVDGPTNFLVRNLNLNSKYAFIRMMTYLIRVKTGDGMPYGVFRNIGDDWGFENCVAADIVFVCRMALAGKIRNTSDTMMWKSNTGISSGRKKLIDNWGDTFLSRLFFEPYSAYHISKRLPYTWLLFFFLCSKSLLSSIKKRLVG